MRIANNADSLTVWRNFTANAAIADKHLTRLSSGLRIASAADDVAGLAISERTRSNILGLRQAMRNVLDGVSLVQTAESSLQEMTELVQRGRELAIQSANGTLQPEDRTVIQGEMQHILAEVDRISETANFNGRTLLGGANPNGKITSDIEAQLVDSLRQSWLANAEDLIEAQYGLTGDGASLKIVSDSDASASYLAYVQGSVDGTGRYTNLAFHVNMAKFSNFVLPNGGSGPLYADRVVAHEMTHAVMMRNMNFAALPNWFVEGTAELIAGADERVQVELAALGNDVNAFVNTNVGAWNGSSLHYAVGYTAAKYLDARSTAAGHAGMKEVMANLKAGQTLDMAIQTATGGAFADANAFLTSFRSSSPGEGQAFVSSLNLSDADVGAIGGGTAQSVVPDTTTETWDPLAHFQEVWPGLPDPGITLQVGSDAKTKIDLPALNIQTASLGIAHIDLVNKPTAAIGQLDNALAIISKTRSELGATQNRLEHAYNVNSVIAENLSATDSKIRDADMALEMSHVVRQQILMQSSGAMLVKANNRHRQYIATLLG